MGLRVTNPRPAVNPPSVPLPHTHALALALALALAPSGDRNQSKSKSKSKSMRGIAHSIRTPEEGEPSRSTLVLRRGGSVDLRVGWIVAAPIPLDDHSFILAGRWERGWVESLSLYAGQCRRLSFLESDTRVKHGQFQDDANG